MAFPFCFRFHTQTSRKECIFVIGKIPGWEIWSELLKGERMGILKMIAAVAVTVILVCFAIFTIASAVYIIGSAIDEWRWEHRRK